MQVDYVLLYNIYITKICKVLSQNKHVWLCLLTSSTAEKCVLERASSGMYKCTDCCGQCALICAGCTAGSMFEG